MSQTASSLNGAGIRNLSWAQRWYEIRTGFTRPFWVANVSELFERLSYYAAFASLARYLHETLRFPSAQAGSLAGLFGGLVWFLAAFGGAVADRMGFRRSLSLAYLILTCAYFLLGSLGAPWFAPVRNAVPLIGGRLRAGPARSRHRPGQTLRGRDNGPHLQRQCPL